MPRSYASDLLANDIDLGGGRLIHEAPHGRRRRSDMLMAFLAACACAGVLFNALALQNGRRDDIASLFALVSADPPAAPAPAASGTATPPSPQVEPVTAPPPAPAPDATTAPVEAPLALLAPVPLPPVKPAVPARKAPAPAQQAIQPPLPLAAATPVQGQNVAPPASVPANMRPPAEIGPSARVMEVQKALANIGYGPLPIDGRTGAATQQAIQRFERDRRLPVSGEVNDRLIRELNAVAGFSIR